MSAKLFKPFLWVGILILVVGMACNLTGSGSQGPVATEAPDQPEETESVTEATEAPATEAPETEEPDRLAVSSLEGVQNAVIQIEAQGTFVNPDFTVSFNSAGLGSGFIIDPSGLAVTNNHVVTGAALFKVWIGGDRNTTYNARVLGVSECSDLAVIDIEGDGFPYLEWHEGPINVGLEVYAAGYPLGEPQFTLTKGIVSKEKAGGETSWASVDYVIEHDATINPGNSGGPLVDEDGRVVGVNYSGRQTNQYFAIGRDLAVRTIDTLKGGKDMETFGINGEAFAGDSFSGIWVYSVKSGSPADKAGLTGGDIVTTLEDLILSSDGTMADYCDILRSHSSDATLDIEVLRYFTQEILVGQINGRELETAYNFAETVEEQGDVQVDDTGGYSGYTMVTDDYGSIQMEIPNEWVDTNGGYWIDGEDTIGAAISAAARSR
jgi:serine protease Do